MRGRKRGLTQHYPQSVRTTVTLDDDVVALIQRVRAEHQVGVSRAVNELIRAGASTRTGRTRYEHRSVPLKLSVDVTEIGAALSQIEDG